MLLSARPFRVGERVRLQGGPLAGQLEGTVSSLGLLYTTFATGDDSIMVPNSVVLNVAVLPLREPEAVNLRARLRAGMTPSDLQEILERSLQTPLRDAPRITLEELDGEEVVVRIAATPLVAAQGRQLASELLSIVVARDALGRDDRVAQEQVGAALERAEQLELHRRIELGAGEDPQRRAACLRVAAREHRREREEELVEQPRGEQLRARCGPPSHSTSCTSKRSRSSASAARRSSAPPRAARTYSTLAAVAASSPATASGPRRAQPRSASSGTPGSSPRLPETMQASGSSASPRSRRSRRVASSRMMRP